jgi:hypothetical protein
MMQTVVTSLSAPHPGAWAMKNAVGETRLAVVEGQVIVEPHHVAARPAQHGVARGGVPFHRAAKAGVDVGLPGRHEAEFQRLPALFRSATAYFEM